MNIYKRPGVFFIIPMIIVFICFGALAGGCFKKPAKSPSKPPTQEKKESPNLEKLQTGIDSLVKEFEKEYLANQAPPPKPPTPSKPAGQGQKAGQDEQGKSSGQQGGQQQGGEQQGGQQQEGQQQGGPAAQATKPDWAKFEKDIAKIHAEWNSFQPEAVKNGATLDMVDGFSQKLNELTTTLTRQDLYQALLAANELYERTVPFEKLFKTKSPPDAKRILYRMRRATYKALAGEDAEAAKDIDEALRVWETVKPQIKDTVTLSKVEYSLKEMGRAIKEKDPNLIKIKAQISEKNIQDAIKSMEK